MAYRSTTLRAFRLRGEQWEQIGAVRLPDEATGLASRDGTDSVYVVLGADQASLPSVARISKSDLEVIGKSALTGVTGESVQIRVLEDGQVVVGHGVGQVDFLDPQLSLRGSFIDGTLTYVAGLADIPALGQVMVSGRTKVVALGAVTRAPQAGAWLRAGAIRSASASVDGRVLATVNFLGSNVTLWSLDLPSIRERMCKAIGRDLTREEWATFVGTEPPTGRCARNDVEEKPQVVGRRCCADAGRRGRDGFVDARASGRAGGQRAGRRPAHTGVPYTTF